jgi:hypothetical protein
MISIGRDYHPCFQRIAMLDEATAAQCILCVSARPLIAELNRLRNNPTKLSS